MQVPYVGRKYCSQSSGVVFGFLVKITASCEAHLHKGCWADRSQWLPKIISGLVMLFMIAHQK